MGSLFSKIVINSKHPIMSKPWGFIDTFSKEEALGFADDDDTQKRVRKK